jgi:hypothetical protein
MDTDVQAVTDEKRQAHKLVKMILQLFGRH